MTLKTILMKVYYCKIKKDKVAYARRVGVRMGKNCQILAKVPECFGTEPYLVKCGDHVDITSGVSFLTHEGGMWCYRGLKVSESEMALYKPIVVGNNVMIGVDSLIMPGVHIGDNVIIAGHSVVTKDVPSNTIVAGVPAKPISSMDKFVEKLSHEELLPIKSLSPKEKQKYLYERHPEWF